MSVADITDCATSPAFNLHEFIVMKIIVMISYQVWLFQDEGRSQKTTTFLFAWITRGPPTVVAEPARIF